MKWRLALLISGALAAVMIAAFLPPIPQNQDYHHFADQREVLGIPHCLDVVSNIFFLIAGLSGIRFVLRKQMNGGAFARPAERWPYFAFFLAVALTAFGSAYYHLHPNDPRLLWDRIPIMLSVLSLLDATLGESISTRAASWLLAPLLLLGACSAIYWEKTQAAGRGDLRAYGAAQFGSILVLLLAIGLFPPRYTRRADLLAAIAIYGAAKIFEAADRTIFSLGGIVSGHTLKHVAAAFAAYWILRMLRLRKLVVPLALSRP